MSNVFTDEYYLEYLRKSRQDKEWETVEEVLARHEKQLQDFAVLKFGHVIPEEYIFREVVSGETIEDRPEINKVLKIIQDPKCKGVLIKEPSRLTRGDFMDLGTIMHAFRYSNTLILTPQKTFDLSKKYDRKDFEHELLRGKDYVEYTKEILMQGRENSAKEGNFISSVAPYGYDRIKIDNKYWTLKINEKEAEMVKLVFHLYVHEGLGATMISHKLNELGITTRKNKRFTPTAIRQILGNETYIGKIRWQAKPVVKVFEDGKVVKKRMRKKDYELFEGKHEAIISDELFNAAQDRKGTVTKEKVDTTLKNPFAGLIKCKKCGGAIAMRIHRKNGIVTRKDRYYCRTGIYCDNKSSNAEVVQALIVKALKQHLEDFKVQLTNNDDSYLKIQENVIQNMVVEVSELEKRKDDLYEFLEAKIYSPQEYIMRKEKYEKEIEQLKERIKKAKAEMQVPIDYEEKYYSLFEALNAMENPLVNAKVKNTLLKNVIEVIYYEKDENDPNYDKEGFVEGQNIKIEIVLKA